MALDCVGITQLSVIRIIHLMLVWGVFSLT